MSHRRRISVSQIAEDLESRHYAEARGCRSLQLQPEYIFPLAAKINLDEMTGGLAASIQACERSLITARAA